MVRNGAGTDNQPARLNGQKIMNARPITGLIDGRGDRVEGTDLTQRIATLSPASSR